jgi:hypothetical protein
MFKQKTLVQACALALSASVALPVYADVCIGKDFRENMELPDVIPPTAKIIRDIYTPRLKAGKSVTLTIKTQTNGGTPVLFVCVQGDGDVGTLEALSDDVSQVKYTAPANISSEAVLKLIAKVGDNQGYAGGDNMYVHLLAGGNNGFTGILKDAAGKPLAGITITIGGQTVTTDENGKFTISGLDAGTYTLDIDGFESISVTVPIENGVCHNVTSSVTARKANKQLVCHNGKTLSIAASAVSAHLAHGDTAGACAADISDNGDKDDKDDKDDDTTENETTVSASICLEPLPMVSLEDDDLVIEPGDIVPSDIAPRVIISKGRGNNEVIIFNAATGEVEARIPTGTSGAALNVRSIDVDGDGIRESAAFASAQGGNEIYIVSLNDYSLTGVIPVEASGVHFDTGDIDGDGISDFAVATNSSNLTSVDMYLSGDNWAKGDAVKLFDKNTRISVAIGDIDGDGRADIIGGDLQGKNASRGQNDVISVYLSGSGALMSIPVLADAQNSQGATVFAYDINCDGKDEILVGSANKGGLLEVYRFDTGELKLLPGFGDSGNTQGLAITAGDVTQDGSPEILIGDAKGIVLNLFDAQGTLLGKESDIVNQGIISSLAVTGGGRCSIQPTPAQAIEEVNEAFDELGSQAEARQENGVVSVSNPDNPAAGKLKYKQDRRAQAPFPLDTPPGLYRLNDDEDYVLVKKSGKQLVFRPLR